MHRLTGDARLLGAYLLDTQSGAIVINYIFQGGHFPRVFEVHSKRLCRCRGSAAEFLDMCCHI